MRENVVKAKSFAFAVRVVKICQLLRINKNEIVLSKQLLRCGTGVGAIIREAEHAETRKDFMHKMGIAQKEINETMYWLELFKETDYLTVVQFESIHSDSVEIIKLVTAILKTTKANTH